MSLSIQANQTQVYNNQAPGRYVPPPTEPEKKESKSFIPKDVFKNSTAQAALEGAVNSFAGMALFAGGISAADLVIYRQKPIFANPKLLGTALIGAATVGAISNAVTQNIDVENKSSVGAAVGFGVGIVGGAVAAYVTKNPNMFMVGASMGALTGFFSVKDD